METRPTIAGTGMGTAWARPAHSVRHTRALRGMHAALLHMVQVAMIASRQIVWRYASVMCVRYPLYEIEGEGFGQAVCMGMPMRAGEAVAQPDRSSSESEGLSEMGGGGAGSSAVAKRPHHGSRQSVLSVVSSVW